MLIKSPIIGLSPMDGYTDEPFRLLQHEIAPPDIMFTEFVSAEGISRGGVKLYDQLLFSSSEGVVIGQLFGKDPDSFYKSAVILSHLGFAGVDINMGCPAKTVTQHGSGAALIDKPDLAREIILSARKGIDDFISGQVTIFDLGLKQSTLDVIARNLEYSHQTGDNWKIIGSRPSLSVKTRLGTSQSSLDTWIPHLLSLPIDFLTLHGRTLRQGYSGVADWDQIGVASQMARQANVGFFGNGDISSRQQALEFIEKYQLTGVLIGRSSLGNPWVFSDHLPSFTEKYQAMVRHASLFTKIFPDRRFDVMRKYFLLYASGHPRAKELRQQLVSVANLDQLYALEDQFLNC